MTPGDPRLLNNASIDNDQLVRMHLSESCQQIPEELKNFLSSKFDLLHEYPDPACRKLRQVIAKYHSAYGLSQEQILACNGTDEAILLINLAMIQSHKSVLTTEMTFPGYESAARTRGAEVLQAPLENSKGGFVLDAKLIVPKVQNQGLVFLCNPHNPTGSTLAARDVRTIVNQAAEVNSIVVIDEAYIDFASNNISAMGLVNEFENVIVLRSLSKSFSLAGLRCGYIVSSEALIEKIAPIKWTLPFSVNSLAQHAAIWSLNNSSYRKTLIDIVLRLKNQTYGVFDQSKISYQRSETNFILVRCHRDTATLTSALANAGYLVRDTGPFGLKDHLRISMNSRADVNQLASLLAGVKK